MRRQHDVALGDAAGPERIPVALARALWHEVRG
jgi:hypothetical protein